MKSTIASISVDTTSQGSSRFVIGLLIAAASTTAKPTAEYFSTMLDKPVNARIAAQQLKNALPELMGTVNPFRKLLLKRSHFIGKEVEIEVTPQIDRQTGKTSINPETKRPYTNVRLVPSHADLTEDQVNKLLAMSDMAIAATEAAASSTFNEEHNG